MNDLPRAVNRLAFLNCRRWAPLGEQKGLKDLGTAKQKPLWIAASYKPGVRGVRLTSSGSELNLEAGEEEMPSEVMWPLLDTARAFPFLGFIW